MAVTKKKNFHILLVDDNKFLVEIYQRQLEKKGYKVTVTFDGEQALEVLSKVEVDLLLLDIMMPKLNGFDVLEEIQKRPKLKKLFIIVHSSLGHEKDIAKAKKLGANDYMIKTQVTTQEIISRIENSLSK